MKHNPFKSLFVWVGLGFTLLVVAWAAIFTLASKTKVKEVPLATSGKT